MTNDEHYLIRVMFDMHPQEFAGIQTVHGVPGPSPRWEVSLMLGIVRELLFTKAAPPCTQTTDFVDGV